MKKLIVFIVILVVAFGAYLLFDSELKNKIEVGQNLSDPTNIAYNIEGQTIKLVDGKAESQDVPDSTSKTVTTIFGKPSYGDMNSDGKDDAVTFLTQTKGGTGTFYYAVIALNKNGAFEGLKAVFLGDRVAPQSILVKDTVAMVNYAVRGVGEAMTVKPSLGATKYLVVEQGEVKEFNLFTKGEQLFVGNLIMAHEVRIFTPCNGTAHWIIGTSTAYADLMKAYNSNKSTSSPYSSVYTVVSGIITPSPTDGFGKDYSYGIDVKNLLKVLPSQSCPKN